MDEARRALLRKDGPEGPGDGDGGGEVAFGRGEGVGGGGGFEEEESEEDEDLRVGDVRTAVSTAAERDEGR